MKNFEKTFIVVLLFFLGGSYNSFSQYLPTLKGNSQWYTYSWFEIGYNTNFQIAGDTIVNDTIYKKLINTPTNSGGSFYEMDLVREDSINKTIFRRLNSTDFLIYDYSLSVGDTFHYINPQWTNGQINLVLDSITDTIYSIISQYLECSLVSPKVFYFHNAVTPTENNIVWVEGIGSLAGPLFPCHNWQGGNEGEALLCHYNENEIRDYHYIYYEEPYPCTGYVGINEIDNANLVNIFPNPLTNGSFKVDGQSIKSIEILSSLGKVILFSKVNCTRPFEFNLENCSRGIYFIRILFNNDNSTIRKIIKQ